MHSLVGGGLLVAGAATTIALVGAQGVAKAQAEAPPDRSSSTCVQGHKPMSVLPGVTFADPEPSKSCY